MPSTKERLGISLGYYNFRQGRAANKLKAHNSLSWQTGLAKEGWLLALNSAALDLI